MAPFAICEQCPVAPCERRMHHFKIIAETVITEPEEATPVTHAYICDAIRTPIGRFAGSLSSVRDQVDVCAGVA